MSSKKSRGRSRNANSQFNIGDIILLEVKRKNKELAKIKWIGKTKLSKTQMYGIEYLKYRIGKHEISGSKIIDGKIGSEYKTPLFKPTKKGYGTFVDSIILNRCAEIKWNRKISDKYMKAKKFDKKKITEAATYGSTKVVKHFLSLLNVKTYHKIHVLKALENSIEYNNHSVVQLIFEHHFHCEYNNINNESKDDEKKLDNNKHKCIFFHAEWLLHIIKNKNRKLLDMVLFFDKWPLIKQKNHISNNAIYELFFTKGNIAFIKYFIQKVVQYKDVETVKMYFNFPLLYHTKNMNSTMTIAAIKGNRWNYLEYLLVGNIYKELIQLQPEISQRNEGYESKEDELNVYSYISEPAPLLLCLVLSMKTHKSLGNIEKFVKIMLNMKANINWFPDIPLYKQLKNLNGESIQSIIDTTLAKTAQVINMSNLFYYDIGKKYKKSQSKFVNKNHFITGSILAAFVYQCSEILDDKTIQKQSEKIKNIIAIFIEYGAILYHNDVEDNFDALINWKKECYPKHIYIYNNRHNQMKPYWIPQSIRGESDYNKMGMILKDAFVFGIAEHKRKLKILFEHINMNDGLKFVFVEFLPDYVCWNLEFVDNIKTSVPSRQVTPKYYSSDMYWSASWS